MEFSVIRDVAGDWDVWAQLQDGSPMHQHESFIIASGETRAQALDNAIRDLRHTVAALEERFEEGESADAVDPHVANEDEPSTREKGTGTEQP